MYLVIKNCFILNLLTKTKLLTHARGKNPEKKSNLPKVEVFVDVSNHCATYSLTFKA